MTLAIFAVFIIGVASGIVMMRVARVLHETWEDGKEEIYFE